MINIPNYKFEQELTLLAELPQNPFLDTDHYKFIHHTMFPKGTTWMSYTWTPRMSRLTKANGFVEDNFHAVFFGLQGVLAKLTHDFRHGFFERPEEEVISEIREQVEHTYAKTSPAMAVDFDYEPFRRLHRLGYLPILVKALPEGTFVPMRVPMFTVENTLPEFYWLPGYLEVILSTSLWQSMTDATIANVYKRIFDKFAAKTSDTPEVTFTQGGDFSMRGLASPEAAQRVGAAHLTSFGVTSTVSARPYAKQYYFAGDDVNAYGPSTEHSVMCSYGTDEVKAYLALIHPDTGVFPSGNITIVSDTYDFWGVVDNILPKIKGVVMRRQGKVSLRPDSGDPVKIICGDPDSDDPTIRKGLIERLYEIIGGTVNSKGYKVLDPHIGAVYGDSITPQRALDICQRLMDKGFASTNVVFGIGSYTYQYNTRDTQGYGYKATAAIINGEFVKIFKDPKTDRDKENNFKKSQKGLVAVVRDEKGELQLVDDLDFDGLRQYDAVNMLRPVYFNGDFVKDALCTFDEIRQRVRDESIRVYGI
ncbi:MAG: nicotinate phosphoribosyltransferase [Candidatus Nomurabacteria bacterium]|jgi:nicotinamide phosphoribosyltransferase|nr:nicotinate phosphoribosyltransferase [Candidatus Nomurabacteria bacterium]